MKIYKLKKLYNKIIIPKKTPQINIYNLLITNNINHLSNSMNQHLKKNNKLYRINKFNIKMMRLNKSQNSLLLKNLQ